MVVADVGLWSNISV